jgi:hypothetical protein
VVLSFQPPSPMEAMVAAAVMLVAAAAAAMAGH